MTKPFAQSAQDYEGWMRQLLGADFVEADLETKHRKMRKNPFAFLRATYWRWAEAILDVCPQLAPDRSVLAIGDTHLENFGTWRDAEGRLVWGANDFDEAAVMPWSLDIVRLAASALLARSGQLSASLICDAILAGYSEGIVAPGPLILERDHEWLRTAVLVPEDERSDFWAKFDAPGEQIPLRFSGCLREAMPDGATDLRFFARSAGVGSLGRPRFVGSGDWRGGPVLREVKAILPPAWPLSRDPTNAPIRAGEIAAGPFRAPDPHYAVAAGLVVRRLSPNNRKIEVGDAPETLLSRDMLNVMGKEIVSCQLMSASNRRQIAQDLEGKNRDWLKAAARAAAQWIEREFQGLD